MIDVPQWPCPKCGAIPETKLHKPFSFEDRLAYRDDFMNGGLANGYYGPEQKVIPPQHRIPCGVEAEHLHHICGRCGWQWTTETLEAAA